MAAFSLPLATSPPATALPATANPAAAIIVIHNLFIASLFKSRTGLFARIIRSEVGHVLFGQAGSDRPHGRMLAIAGLVGLQRVHDIARILPAELGYVIGLRIGGAKPGDAVASGAHGVLV